MSYVVRKIILSILFLTFHTAAVAGGNGGNGSSRAGGVAGVGGASGSGSGGGGGGGGNSITSGPGGGSGGKNGGAEVIVVGGSGDGSFNPGSGSNGYDFSSAAVGGGPGANGATTGNAGGGGGGGVYPGGKGGNGGNARSGGGGGGGNTNVLTSDPVGNLAGGDGGNAGDQYLGGGGGGGGDGAIANQSPMTFAFDVTGGTGGAGGGNGGFAGSGGGGGAGLVLNSASGNFTINNSSTITGGNGGPNGGADSARGGGAGCGIFFNQPASLTHSGIIVGGNGVAKGTSNGGNGGTGMGGALGTGNYSQGGAGIVGASSGSTSIVSSGTITGGLSGDGVTRANAVTFSGTNNSLNLLSGSLTSGQIVMASGMNTVTVNDSADISNVPTINLGTASTNALSFNLTSSFIYGGTIIGTGRLSKQGSGSLELTGANTYTGGTTISGGELSVNNNSGLGTGSVTFNGASTTLKTTAALTNFARTITLTTNGTFDTNGFDSVFSGVISGAGVLTKQGNGTQTLSAINTYTGGTTIRGGTLRQGVANAISRVLTSDISSSNNFDLNGFGSTLTGLSGGDATHGTVTSGPAATLSVGNSSSDNYSYGGVISGAVTFAKTGTNTQTLTGTNTYTGGTIIRAGTLQVQSNANLGSVAGSLTLGDGATHTRGTLRLAGNNFSTSRSLIIAGTAGGAVDLNGNNASFDTTNWSVSSSPLEINNSSATAAVLTLTGSNTNYTGTITVAKDELKINGSLEAAAIIASGARLSGNATLRAVTINGTIAPGNSIGQISINGNYIQNGTYVCEVGTFSGTPVAGTDNDLIAVTGNATLGGDLYVIPSLTLSTGQSARYKVLTSSSLTGTFSNVTGSSPLFKYVSEYDGGDAYVVLSKNQTYHQVISSGNSGVLADYTDHYASPSLIQALSSLTEAQLNTAFKELSPTQNTQRTNYISHTQLGYMDNPFRWGAMDRLSQRINYQSIPLLKRLMEHKQSFLQVTSSKLSNKTTSSYILGRDINPKHIPISGRISFGHSNLWLQGGMTRFSQRRIADPSGMSTQGLDGGSYDTSIGIDHSVTPNLKLGLTTGYDYNHYKMKTNSDRGTIKSSRFGIYGFWQKGAGPYVNAASYYTHHRFNANRIMTVVPAVAYQKHGGASVGGIMEVGKDINVQKQFIATPYVGMGAIYMHENSYNEMGAGNQNLSVKKRNQTTVQGKAGIQISNFWKWHDNKTQIYSFARLGVTYRRALGSFQKVSGSLLGQDGLFTVRIRNKDIWLANPSVGFTANLYSNLSSTLSYEGDIGLVQSNHQVLIRINYLF